MAQSMVDDEGSLTVYNRKDYTDSRQTELEDDILHRIRVFDAIASYKVELPTINKHWQKWSDALAIADERMTEFIYEYVARYRGYYLDGKGRGPYDGE